jgi:hypothetical protein
MHAHRPLTRPVGATLLLVAVTAACQDASLFDVDNVKPSNAMATALPGEVIGFTLGTPDGLSDIAVISPDGTGLTKLTDTPLEELMGGWSSDGSKILFTRGDPATQGGSTSVSSAFSRRARSIGFCRFSDRVRGPCPRARRPFGAPRQVDRGPGDGPSKLRIHFPLRSRSCGLSGLSHLPVLVRAGAHGHHPGHHLGAAAARPLYHSHHPCGHGRL